MNNKAQDDDLVMNLVDLALAQPADQRESYLKSACGDDSDLFDQVWKYVLWEQQMGGFLLEPLIAPAAPDHPFEPGELLDGRFRILRELAHGGMGVVYEATDEKLGRRIALKCARPGHGKRLPPEVRHASEVSHPNICKIFEIHTASTRYGEIDFITMEFLDGPTLAERLRRGPLPDAEARTIARQLSEGLAEAHRNRVIHGDLKSNNVILAAGPDGATRAVITDFGLARRPDASHRTALSGEQGGTPAYMAPELWKGEKASVASDIYALGVIFFELASGRRPNERVPALPPSQPTVTLPEPNSVTWTERLTRRPVPVNPRWDRILARCLDPHPARRYRSADELVQAFAPSRTRRRVLSLSAAAVLAAFTGVLSYEWATAPKETVRLAILPFDADQNNTAVAGGLAREAASRIARLKSSARTGLRLIPLSRTRGGQVDTPGKAFARLGATHVLRASLRNDGDKVAIRVFITDASTQTAAADWNARYAPGEVRYIPAALAGVVTGTFHLPPSESPPVSASARTDYRNGLARLRRDSGVDAALQLLERAVLTDPDSAPVRAALAEAQWFKYYATDDKSWLALAEESAREAEIREPDSGAVHRIKGLLEKNSGRYDRAADEFRRAIELNPEDGDAHRRLGQVYEQNNRLDEALSEYRRAIEAAPREYRSLQALAAFYFHRGDYTQAIREFRKAVEMVPDEPVLHFALGSTYNNVGQYAAAEGEFRIALRLAESPVTLYALGLVLLYEGKDREAVSYISRALSREPEQYLWWMTLGSAERQAGSKRRSERAYRRAFDLAEKKMARDPRDGRVRARLGYLCARLGDPRRAASEISQALQLSPNDAETRFWGVITNELLGRREDALSVLRASPKGVLADIGRWPDVGDLRKDPRFLELLAPHSVP